MSLSLHNWYVFNAIFYYLIIDNRVSVTCRQSGDKKKGILLKEAPIGKYVLSKLLKATVTTNNISTNNDDNNNINNNITSIITNNDIKEAT